MRTANQNDAYFVQIAILSSPLRRLFDYLPCENTHRESYQPGLRVKVPFRNKTETGIVLAITNKTALPVAKLKRIKEILDKSPLVPPDVQKMLFWSGGYYHHPIGEVIGIGFPPALRQGQADAEQTVSSWEITESGRQINIDNLSGAPRQSELMRLLAQQKDALAEEIFNQTFENWRPTMRRLVDKGWVEQTEIVITDTANELKPERNEVVDFQLNSEQQLAVECVLESQHTFQPFLLEGVTGSGKTEVYLKLIDQIVSHGRQVLVLVPEISLTPQMTRRFQSRLNHTTEVLHSALTDKQRMEAWLRAKDGKVNVVIGTRSAITTPFPELGLIIIDEEHDSSFKQQEGFRYSARDMAVMRSQILNIPVVLGSATPSFESLHNVNQERYRNIKLEQRYGKAKPPSVNLVDLRSQPLHDGLSLKLLETMKQHLAKGNQVLLFINRRGFAPTLLCHDCGWIARCQRCDSHMTYHHGKQKLRCHHCGAERRAEQSCPDCTGSTLIPVGEGTERVEQALNKQMPDVDVIRIDRDTTRRKGSLESLLAEVHQGGAKILIGTQMLAKGHHFPDVTLVGILNIDQGLFSVDFRALEKTAQLIVQVSGRAGREEKPGEVMLQTHYPDHPLLQILLQSGYAEFAQQALKEREQTCLPPYSYMALLRAEAVDVSQPLEFLREAKNLAQEFSVQDVELLGPMPSPMEKRAGRFRAQLFVQSSQRSTLHKLLKPWVLALEKSKLGRKVRWSIDVDPVDVY